MKYREAARKLASLGCEIVPRRGKGSHRVWHNPNDGRLASIPDWGARDLKIGTLRAVVRQLGFEWEDFLKA
jgi:mRNA interferase HicA